jgi:hypothetical protein
VASRQGEISGCLDPAVIEVSYNYGIIYWVDKIVLSPCPYYGEYPIFLKPAHPKISLDFEAVNYR